MKPNPSTSRVAARPADWLAALVASLLLALAACGPGVGGTGTGPSETALPAFGAAATSVCGSDFVALLPCAGAAPAQPAPGATATHFADLPAPSRVALRIEGDRAELLAPCAGLNFSGDWGRVEGQPARFYGRLGTELASVSVQAAGAGISVQVFDARGVTLLGPLLLSRVPAAVTPDCR